MCQPQEYIKLLCLLLLAVGLPCSQAEVFPQCVNVADDTFVMAIEDCTSYIYCNGEDSFRDSCPDQTYFDAKAQECAFDDAGVCLQRVETTTIGATEASAVAAEETQNNNKREEVLQGLTETTTTAATVGSPSATAATAGNPTATVAPDGSRPHCDAAGDGYYPHPQRCEYYYSCLGGYLTIVRCPYNYGWDYAQLQCKPLSEAQCFSL